MTAVHSESRHRYPRPSSSSFSWYASQSQLHPIPSAPTSARWVPVDSRRIGSDIPLCCVQLVSGLSIVGGDKRKVGYYTGMLVRHGLIVFKFSSQHQRLLTELLSQMSLHYAAEAVTVLQWSRCSDHIGRKPILLLGLAGSVVSTILFGLSRSFWALVLRCA